MASFTVRVELHGSQGDPEAYDTLHAAMGQIGFSRTITVNGKEYHLPDAEYVVSTDSSREEVYAAAKAAADTTGLKAGIVVTESKGRYAGGLRLVKNKVN